MDSPVISVGLWDGSCHEGRRIEKAECCVQCWALVLAALKLCGLLHSDTYEQNKLFLD
jgi:energy-converting hydrogenase Eha subunit F